MRRLVIALALSLVAQEASAQCAGQRVNYFWQHNCVPCRQVEAFLDRNGVRYSRENIAYLHVQDYLRKRSVLVSSPIVESQGRFVPGYDEPALRQLLCIVTR